MKRPAVSPNVRRKILLPAALVLLTFAVLLLPGGIRPLWPPLLALVVVFSTRLAAWGLFLGGAAGCLLLAGGDPLRAAVTWWNGHLGPAFLGSWTMTDGFAALPSQWHQWHLGAVAFTLLLGAFAALLEHGGGLRSLLHRDVQGAPAAPRRFLTSVYGLGLLCFFDGLANSLMVGRVTRPLADRLRIPRAFLAYVVDTTSSAVACVAFISTWIAVQLTLIGDGSAALGIETPAYLLFLQSVPRNYYCLFALLLGFLAVRRQWMIGPMRKARTVELREEDSAAETPTAPLWRALVPLLVLVLAIPLLYYLLHRGPEVPPRFPVTPHKIQEALGSNSGPAAFVAGSALALLVAGALLSPFDPRRVLRVARRGALQLLPALGVLVLAWVLGSVLRDLGTAAQVADLLGGSVPLPFLPAAVSLLGCLMSFVSGTSWGTMALLMPLALPAIGPMAEAQGLPAEAVAQAVPAVIAAVFGGAVFGDHCSPFSDTTIVSALACGITTTEHTLTQLPYALLAAGVALGAGYLPHAVGLDHRLGLLAGAIVLVAVVRKVR
jgi:Na+/H+ antiporter NhaC